MVATAERGTAQAIREEAAKLFFERGYDATSLRQVASAVGLMVGSLYNHIDSKEHLLLQIMGGIIDDLLASARKAVEIDGDAVDKLQAALAAHLRFHAERAQEVFIGNAELRSLSDDAREVVIAKRHEYELFLQELIEEAGRAGLAEVIDPRIHVYSFVAQATHIASWFKPGGRMSLDEIVSVYTKLALRELNVPDADARVDR
ncbi:TetR/AcrR family transcriptional regulator [Arthrobacter sp. StoSoilB20]|uniref:TetR/AcrR family transcriptional regulator n=1 Tax=Arthrobacter sp. StoSoilB20 TaxID=2830995 RepID=UPI001CC645DB|nr:TetR/AcrR family transcriptional regulator [Arthrobacter sp. StoSoilB20]BCW58602.1 TetR family transcriptional regulator [Arthrobacter sp. StoSoilB20]